MQQAWRGFDAHEGGWTDGLQRRVHLGGWALQRGEQIGRHTQFELTQGEETHTSQGQAGRGRGQIVRDEDRAVGEHDVHTDTNDRRVWQQSSYNWSSFQWVRVGTRWLSTDVRGGSDGVDLWREV